jgi:hypothetical protein
MELKVKQYNDNASMSLDIELNNGFTCCPQFVSTLGDRLRMACKFMEGAHSIMATCYIDDEILSDLEALHDKVATRFDLNNLN